MTVIFGLVSKSTYAVSVLSTLKFMWFSSSTPISSTNKTDCRDIAEILSKVALDTITQNNSQISHESEILLLLQSYKVLRVSD